MLYSLKLGSLEVGFSLHGHVYVDFSMVTSDHRILPSYICCIGIEKRTSGIKSIQLQMAFENHPETAEKGRSVKWGYGIPVGAAPYHEYAMLGTRIAKITSTARGMRIWLAERHRFDSVGSADMVDYSRDELVSLLEWTELRFTPKNRPNAAYHRELTERGLW